MSSDLSINFVIGMDMEDSHLKAGDIRQSSDCGHYFMFHYKTRTIVSHFE